jgi:methyl-accepting chemotaxis protein
MTTPREAALIEAFCDAHGKINQVTKQNSALVEALTNACKNIDLLANQKSALIEAFCDAHGKINHLTKQNSAFIEALTNACDKISLLTNQKSALIEAFMNANDKKTPTVDPAPTGPAPDDIHSRLALRMAEFAKIRQSSYALMNEIRKETGREPHPDSSPDCSPDCSRDEELARSLSLMP